MVSGCEREWFRCGHWFQESFEGRAHSLHSRHGEGFGHPPELFHEAPKKGLPVNAPFRRRVTHKYWKLAYEEPLVGEARAWRTRGIYMLDRSMHVLQSERGEGMHS